MVGRMDTLNRGFQMPRSVGSETLGQLGVKYSDTINLQDSFIVHRMNAINIKREIIPVKKSKTTIQPLVVLL